MVANYQYLYVIGTNKQNETVINRLNSDTMIWETMDNSVFQECSTQNFTLSSFGDLIFLGCGSVVLSLNVTGATVNDSWTVITKHGCQDSYMDMVAFTSFADSKNI